MKGSSTHAQFVGIKQLNEVVFWHMFRQNTKEKNIHVKFAAKNIIVMVLYLLILSLYMKVSDSIATFVNIQQHRNINYHNT